MQLKTLHLHQFRNLASWQHTFSSLTLLHGHNGAGKTSILEALMIAVGGGSFRANKIEEVIRLGQEIARIQAVVVDDEAETTQLEVLVTRGVVQGKRTQSRHYMVNGLRRRKKDFVGNFAAVIFRPEDMRLIEGSPSRRRAFLDAALCAVDWRYEQALSVYEKTLRQRNRLLNQVAERKQPRASLVFWNTSLCKHGEYVQQKRQELLQFLQTIGFRFTLQVRYLPSIISETRLTEYIDREIMVGHSLIGPHKDDFAVEFPGALLQAGSTEWLDIGLYGSRGQQRLVVLWLKLGELEYVRHKLGKQPVLLLDDILSELDGDSRSIVMEIVQSYQTIISTADHESAQVLQQELPTAELVELDSTVSRS